MICPTCKGTGQVQDPELKPKYYDVGELKWTRNSKLCIQKFYGETIGTLHPMILKNGQGIHFENCTIDYIPYIEASKVYAIRFTKTTVKRVGKIILDTSCKGVLLESSKILHFDQIESKNAHDQWGAVDNGDGVLADSADCLLSGRLLIVSGNKDAGLDMQGTNCEIDEIRSSGNAKGIKACGPGFKVGKAVLHNNLHNAILQVSGDTTLEYADFKNTGGPDVKMGLTAYKDRAKKIVILAGVKDKAAWLDKNSPNTTVKAPEGW